MAPSIFLSTQCPGPWSIELISTINAAATNSKNCLRLLCNLQAIIIFCSSLKILFASSKQCPSKITTTSRGAFLVVMTFVRCCISHSPFLPPFLLPYYAPSNLQNRQHLSHQYYCWRWAEDQSQVPCYICLLRFLSYHALYFTHQDEWKLHSLQKRENHREERRKGWTHFACLPIQEFEKDSRVWQESHSSRQCLTHE